MTQPGKVSSTRAYNGRVISLDVDEVRFPDGSIGSLEMIRHPGASAVVPLLDADADDPTVILIRQYRYAADGYLYEIPAGRLDAGETPMECAHRELAEETGYRATRVEQLFTMFTTTGTRRVFHHPRVAAGAVMPLVGGVFFVAFVDVQTQATVHPFPVMQITADGMTDALFQAAFSPTRAGVKQVPQAISTTQNRTGPSGIIVPSGRFCRGEHRAFMFPVHQISPHRMPLRHVEMPQVGVDQRLVGLQEKAMPLAAVVHIPAIPNPFFFERENHDISFEFYVSL